MNAAAVTTDRIASSGAVWQPSAVTRQERWLGAGSEGMTVWLTGLSGSGKSAIADCALGKLVAAGRAAYVLDADNIRHGLNADLGFSPEDRKENVRSIGEVARILADAGIVCLVPIISPYRADRDHVRRLHGDAGLAFLEVFVDTPIDVCQQRDPKGLYRRALAGDLPEFTGISAPYETPETPDLVVCTDGTEVGQVADRVVELVEHGSPSRSHINSDTRNPDTRTSDTRYTA
jgi:bifunctional enzyme CysN/CysC